MNSKLAVAITTKVKSLSLSPSRLKTTLSSDPVSSSGVGWSWGTSVHLTPFSLDRVQYVGINITVFIDKDSKRVNHINFLGVSEELE
jgi:hypothetical protein